MLDALLKHRTDYNFKDTITRHSKGSVIALKETEGHYDMGYGGVWIDGSVEEIILYPASILPLSRDELRYAEGGVYNEDSRKLYCYEKLEKKTKIIHTMLDETVRHYTILQLQDYSDYDKGLRIYYLKRADEDDTDN